MTKIKLCLATTLAMLGAALAGATLSSDPEWSSVPGKGTDVVMEELTLSYELRKGVAEATSLTGDVNVSFESDYFNLT
jgi:hypothetical protein